MAQLPHLQVGDVPIDITDGLSAGCYVAQVREYGDGLVLIATAPAAPADRNDWFVIDGRGFFTFTVGDVPTWAVLPDAGPPIAVAIASA